MRHPLRILTYNVHGCVGGDRCLDPGRIVDVITMLRPDIVGLQELDVDRRRSGGVDQAKLIAAGLEMKFVFHPAMHVAGERYGDAILTSLPMRTIKTGALPSVGEPRGAIWCEIDHNGRKLQVFNTHLGVGRRERLAQLRTLLGANWLGSPDCLDRDVIALGDFNSVPSSSAFAQIARKLVLARPPGSRYAPPAFPARLPLLRLDHVFHSAGLRCTGIEVSRKGLPRIASDHLPLLAVLEDA